MSGTDERLEDLLRAELPPGILALDETVRADLADLVAEARRNQARSLAEAFEATLRHVPFPVRGVVRKVLLG